jgi:hypothetical protein
MKYKILLFTILILIGATFAQGGPSGKPDISEPWEKQCSGNGGIVDFTCNIMKTLLELGPMVAVIALITGGSIYVYGNVFVTADQRGRYQTLAMNIVVGALILAAIVGGAGILTNAGIDWLTTS